jgi:hypothetical protein
MSVEQSLEESMIATLEAMEQEDEEEGDEPDDEDGEGEPTGGAEDEPESGAGDEAEEPEAGKHADDPPDAAPAAGKKPGSDKQPKQPAEPPLDPALELPPTGWDAESKAKYKDLPAWMKKVSHKREQDMLKGVDQLKRQIQSVEPITKAAEPYRAFLNSKGVSLDGLVSSSLNFAYSLATGSAEQKQGIILSLAKQYGVDLSNIPKPDPNTQQYQQHIAPVLNEVQQLKQELFQRKQAEQQQHTAQAQTAIEKFATETDESGQPKHPFLDRVQEDMAVLLESGRATTLQDAYDKAVWSNPDTRQLMQQKQLAAETAKRQAEAKERAAKAKRSSQVNLEKRGQHDSSSRKPTGSLDDTLKETFDRLAS